MFQDCVIQSVYKDEQDTKTDSKDQMFHRKSHEIKQLQCSTMDAVRSRFEFYIREEDKATNCIGAGKW